ncbi:uncharacterized protein NEMAJ01_2328 [Nematocida major]|uniref:uncharacterized protein n=1 Tax=Nematocida major TaxID=1912982 RepID=UPI002008349C|nr:uncharacterized protein NEMAJ01_2328 [Nematocida major]KAH9387432.1 hypothetical protein NEMAJ01_2328 [Nematocida major]
MNSTGLNSTKSKTKPVNNFPESVRVDKFLDEKFLREGENFIPREAGRQEYRKTGVRKGLLSLSLEEALFEAASSGICLEALRERAESGGYAHFLTYCSIRRSGWILLRETGDATRESPSREERKSPENTRSSTSNNISESDSKRDNTSSDNIMNNNNDTSCSNNISESDSKRDNNSDNRMSNTSNNNSDNRMNTTSNNNSDNRMSNTSNNLNPTTSDDRMSTSNNLNPTTSNNPISHDSIPGCCNNPDEKSPGSCEHKKYRYALFPPEKDFNRKKAISTRTLQIVRPEDVFSLERAGNGPVVYAVSDGDSFALFEATSYNSAEELLRECAGNVSRRG